MDGAKRKSISASELYAAIDTAKAPLVVDAQRAPAPDAGPPMIIGAVRCQPTTSPRGTGIGARVSRSSETSPRGPKR